MEPTSQEFVKFARRAFKRIFKSYVKAKAVDESIFLPDEDPGEWAPRSVLVVHKEHGIPDRFVYPTADPLWTKVEEYLSGLLGKPVYFEDVNGAVSALYWV